MSGYRLPDTDALENRFRKRCRTTMVKATDWIVISFPTSKMVGVHEGYTQIRGDDLDG